MKPFLRSDETEVKRLPPKCAAAGTTGVAATAESGPV
jgi:hypothetical protein